ncbi:MAG: FAD-dependent oxidoreductase [Candidatus Eisenbacteria bacterium]
MTEPAMRDPICGMEVDSEDFGFEYEGKKNLFCSLGCLDRFKSQHKDYLEKHMYDLVIIGGGPAGLTAAVYVSVQQIDTILLAKDIGGQAIDSTKIKNYMGFDFISGPDLVRKFSDQFLHKHYLDHCIDEVVNINRADDSLEILTRAKRRLRTRATIVASGMKRRKLGIPGEERLQRRGIFYRMVHDIPRLPDSVVAVVGGGNSAVQTANDLKGMGCEVILLSKGNLIADQSDIDVLRGSERVEILERYDVVEIKGEDKVEGIVIQTDDGKERREARCDGVFIQVGFTPNTEFCQDLVGLNERGEIIIGPDCSTNVAGVFACGDAANSFGKRIIIASGEGAKAALSAKDYLLKKRR